MKKALITGINGQDGSYLAELLLEKGYEVHGLRRKASSFNTSRINHLISDWHNENNRLILHYSDMTDSLSVVRLLQEIQPDEIYNLAAMSHVFVSFQNPESTANVDGIVTLRLLESIRLLGFTEKVKFYQASTSELYGKVQETPQSETTPFYPRSPYAVAKLYSFWITKNYREAYNMFACNGILFNHESPRRGETFVTRKITMGVADIVNGKRSTIYLGNLNAKRDWGHAKDYVRGMYLMLQHETPEDFVLSTGTTTTVREFIIRAFKVVGIELKFEGQNDNESAIVINEKYPHLHNTTVVKVDPLYYRPTEVELLLGDSSKARKKLKWEPEYSLDEMIEEMVMNDLKR